MISRFRSFLRRLKSGSFKRMFLYIDQIHKETGRSRVLTFLDMCCCILFRGIGYLEYRVYGFDKLRSPAQRDTFMNMTVNKEIIAAFNDARTADAVFEDKAAFLERFRPWIPRKWLDLRTASREDLDRFLDEVDVFFVKPLDDFGGHGIRRCVTAETEREGLYDSLKAEGLLLVEEGIRQHPLMNSINASSVNTLRMVTLVDREGTPHLIYSLLRMGRNHSVVDNISSGGLYTKIRPDGTLCANAFCDFTGEILQAHPDSGVVFGSFSIPCYAEAVQMCLDAALVVPEVRYVGWDVTITGEGPTFVEGNPMPGYDMIQNYAFADEDGSGILPEFRKYL